MSTDTWLEQGSGVDDVECPVCGALYDGLDCDNCSYIFQEDQFWDEVDAAYDRVREDWGL